jgi:hypothetical protein
VKFNFDERLPKPEPKFLHLGTGLPKRALISIRDKKTPTASALRQAPGLYPLPWQSLKYDTNLGGYRTGITENQLKGAPKYSNDNYWNWNDPARAKSVNNYYGVAI